MTATIRIARPEDAAALAALKLRTFRETFLEEGFAIPYPAADLAIFEADSYSVPAIAAELADAGRRSWVAEADGRLLGYAQVGPCKLPHPEAGEEQGELYQLYLLREAQGMKLGKALLDAAIAYLAETRPGPVWLGVWSGNDKAQAVYAARGFEKVGEYRFKVGSWYDEEYILRKG
ncbi:MULTISPECIES: GNAT family N-acetyltransferase [unclassified Sphingomonas]|uniref:GNAT family N-acetyltransferase n=1 Tax=unclassified Sphingomonas TaxID=196159 RepID=UPI0006FDFE66|nr:MULTISPECIES: GNAT family N-acetyltransferase [unclassified Sphingomonas]KQX20876.1 acetyltransferase [Sphingomonas sp. Root1294]KQY68722.1 acetyltransferase [Sphingomonas sp. Root50]KRB88128.1 acetyltransferase [Sphingomonas sp. Root720]